MARKSASSKSSKKRTAAKPTPKRRGRPRKAIDPAAVERLIAAGKTVEGAALQLGCDHRTLERNFAPAIKKGREGRNSRLQEVQFNLAVSGNVPMAIWLGKQWLGQKNRVELETRDTGEYRVAGRPAQEALAELQERLNGHGDGA
jgi:hypothetical protein